VGRSELREWRGGRGFNSESTGVLDGEGWKGVEEGDRRVRGGWGVEA